MPLNTLLPGMVVTEGVVMVTMEVGMVVIGIVIEIVIETDGGCKTDFLSLRPFEFFLRTFYRVTIKSL